MMMHNSISNDVFLSSNATPTLAGTPFLPPARRSFPLRLVYKSFQCGQSDGLSLGEENGVFEGYASVYNVVDSDGDILRSGAFKSAVKEFESGVRPHLLWQHKTDEVIGKITHMVEDAKGLKITASLLLDINRGKEAYCLLKNGLIRGLSIGFVPVLVTRDAHQTRHILHVKLCEVSLVTMPSNPLAQVHAVKGVG